MSKENTPVATKPSWKEKYFNLYNTKFTVRGEKYHLGETSVAYALLLGYGIWTISVSSFADKKRVKRYYILWFLNNFF